MNGFKRAIRFMYKYLCESDYRFIINADRGMYNHLDDETFLIKKFKVKLGYDLNLENPKTFNEKLQWLKVHDKNPQYTQLVDKYEVKKYVASVIGEEHIIPTLGVWNTFDEIDFSTLPEKFVLKTTHDSGGIVICKNKYKFKKFTAKIKLEMSLRRNFFYIGREWPYKDVKPRIIAEKYMEDTSTAELRDYKFFCFGGLPKCYKVDFDRFIDHKANYFTADGELMRLGEEVCPPNFEKDIPIPENLGMMKELAAKLANDIPFLRVDFYNVDGMIYFGELTFYPASGFGKFIYEGNDELLGSWIRLPESLRTTS